MRSAYFLLFVLLAGALATTALAQSPAEPKAGKWFYITSNVSGLNLDVYGANQWIGNRICQAAANKEQVWRLIPAENDCWYIQSGVSGLNLDVLGGERTVGSPIVQAKPTPGQVWRFDAASDGSYFIRSAVSDLYLDDFAARHDVGNKVVQAKHDPIQTWTLTEATDATPRFPIRLEQSEEGERFKLLSLAILQKGGHVDIESSVDVRGPTLEGSIGVAVWFYDRDEKPMCHTERFQFKVPATKERRTTEARFGYELNEQQQKSLGSVAIVNYSDRMMRVPLAESDEKSLARPRRQTADAMKDLAFSEPPPPPQTSMPAQAPTSGGEDGRAAPRPETDAWAVTFVNQSNVVKYVVTGVFNPARPVAGRPESLTWTGMWSIPPGHEQVVTFVRGGRYKVCGSYKPNPWDLNNAVGMPVAVESLLQSNTKVIIK